jgi:hypothetical protein
MKVLLTGHKITEINNDVIQNNMFNKNDKVYIDDITELYIVNTKISELKNLPKNLIKLHVKNNIIEILDCSILPDNLKELYFMSNMTQEIINLKNGITNLNLSNNLFGQINCVIPSSVTDLNLSSNENLTNFPIFENFNLQKLDISSTPISTFNNTKYIIDNLNISKYPIKIINNNSNSNIMDIMNNMNDMNDLNNNMNDLNDSMYDINRYHLNYNKNDMYRHYINNKKSNNNIISDSDSDDDNNIYTNNNIFENNKIIEKNNNESKMISDHIPHYNFSPNNPHYIVLYEMVKI